MIRLHHVPFTRSFRVLWLLKEMGLDCEVVSYRLADGSLRTPAFLALSPAGRVPALEIDGRVLFESGAITEYLCESRPEHGLGRAPGEAERTQFLEWIHFAETQASALQALNLQWLFLRDPGMRSRQVLKMEARRLAVTLEALERVLQGQEHLLASGFSAADTMLGFNLWAAPHFVRMDPFPAVMAYRDRLEARAGYRAALAQNGTEAIYSQEFYDPSTL